MWLSRWIRESSHGGNSEKSFGVCSTIRSLRENNRRRSNYRLKITRVPIACDNLQLLKIGEQVSVPLSRARTQIINV